MEAYLASFLRDYFKNHIETEQEREEKKIEFEELKKFMNEKYNI